MAYFDNSLEKLQSYLPERNEPLDFNHFWKETLVEKKSFELKATFSPVYFGIHTVDFYDVSFSGFQG